MEQKIKTYSTKGLVQACKDIKVIDAETLLVRGMMLQEIERREGEEFTDNLMTEIGM